MVKYADRMNQVKGSEIREFLALTAKPDIISFAGGMPAPELFPNEEVLKATEAAMQEYPDVALQYSSTEGMVRLREQIAARMKVQNGIETDAQHILMTSGSQEGLAFSAQVFLSKDDVVLLESPSYLGAINAFRTCEPVFVDIPTDKDGMLMDELEKVLQTTERVKMIYVIPDFQNPTGKTWSLERRKRFMELVNKYEVPVIEDNPYGDLRFEGETLPSLKSMDTKGLVVYLGTFSKILSPGLRLGWVCAETEILEKYNFIKQAMSLQAPTLSMLAASKWLDMYDLDAHVDKIREVYKRRKNLMLDIMKKELTGICKFTDPEGGLFTWMEMPEHMNAKEIAMKCLEEKVAFVTGTGFYPYGGHENTLRLNYSNSTDEKIVEGMTKMCRIIKENV